MTLQARSVAWALLLSAALSSQAAAQDRLGKIRDLYSAAEYEEVLSAVSGIPDTEVKPDASQYRVFALMALGRPAEAERAAEQMVTANLRFHPQDASPRIAELFTKVRRRVAPDALKAMYVTGREAFGRKESEAAARIFADIVATADDPDLLGDTTVGEIRLLASGFLDLSRAAAAPAKPSQPAATEGNAPTNAPKVSPPTIKPPTPISQVLPPWNPPPGISLPELRGAIRVEIDVTGHVSASQIVTPIHPNYDALLLAASKKWTYEPALSNGAPIPSERLVNVVLKAK
jgi:hypothetical protein